MVDRVLTCKTVEGVSFVNGGDIEGLNAASGLDPVSRLVVG